jgi:O-antigen ligase
MPYKIKLDKRTLSLKIYFICITISLLLVSDKKIFLAISFQRFPALDTIISVSVIVIGGILLHRKSWKIDYITVLLFSRLLFALITAISVSATLYSTIKALCVFIAALFGYYVFYNKPLDVKESEFSLLISIYLFTLSLQTIGVYLLNYINMSIVSKSLVEIPIGRSNLIATHLLICIVYLYSSKYKSILMKVSLILGFLSLIMTFSFGALISLVSLIAIKNILINKRANIKQVMSLLILVIVIIYYIFMYYPRNIYYDNGVFSNINRNIWIKINYFMDGNYERLFSDRFILYQESWSKFIDSPLLGNFDGLQFRGRDNYRAHNLFLEAFSSYGVLGFILLVFPLCRVLKKIMFNIRKRQGNPILLPSFLALSAGVIHGLVEPNFYSLEYEFIWWSIAGFAISSIKNNIKLN